VKRSNREGPLADIPSARLRFAAEAGFLILVAVGAALAELRPLAIIILMACAWLLVALIERASSRETVRPDEVEPVPELAPQAEPLPATEAREAYRWYFWRRARARTEELASPTASLEERPARSHVRRLELEPVEAPAAAAEPPPEPAEPGPAVTTRPLDLPGLEEPTPARESAPSSSRPRFLQRPARAAAPSVPPSPPPPPPAKEWNIWDLERRAREQAGDGARDEEWSALFTHLRPFANADGVLPKEFDDLVRESFGQLIEAA
jgi:hypothetical protein